MHTSHFRTLDSSEPVARYLHLKAEIKALTEEMKALEPMIWDAVDEEGGEAAFAGFKLESCVSRSYRYSDAVEEAEAALRSMKAAERKAGTAEVTKATGYVRVTEDRAADLDAAGEPTIDLDALAAEVSAPSGDGAGGPPARPF